MAVSLSNTFSFYNSPQTPQFSRTAFCPPPPRISLSTNLSSQLSSKTLFLFNSAFLVQASSSTPEIYDQDEIHQDNMRNKEIDEVQKSSTLKSLMKVYKEAVLIGDEKTASDVESVIREVENEKTELVTKTSTLAAELNAGKERYIRLQADFDNFRKRSEKEKLTIRSDAQGEVIRSLLPMVDNFERAKQQLKLQTDQEKKIDASYQGIYKQFVEIMRSLRVSVVATVGQPFDPLLHEAIAREQSHEFKEGIIVQEFRRGFLLGDRLLRPATVKVSAGPGKKKSSTVTTEQAEQSAAAAGVNDSR